MSIYLLGLVTCAIFGVRQARRAATEHQVWQGAWMIALCHLWPIWLIGWIAATIHSKRSRKENAK